MGINKHIRNLISEVKVKIKNLINSRHYRLIPYNPLHDDLYIVEFPKSGITWLSVLMANVHLKCSDLNTKANFYNVRDYIPDIHQTRSLKNNILNSPGFRVIKSHSEYNPLYKKIIYLVRDPRDVMVSYYFFTRNLNMFNGTISEFIRSELFGIDAWVRHIGAWVDYVNVAQFINFIRYEDMKADPKIILERIYKLHGLTISDDYYEYAIKQSCFEEMKRGEQYYREGNLALNSEFNFHRKGASGGYDTELSNNDIEFIVGRAEKYMKKFDYI